MRMVHYYLALAVFAAPALLLTAVTGIWHDGSQTHVSAGLFTSIYLVGVSTLLILFMIVTGRVLKAAMRTRELAPEFLQELNEFFARKSAYPVAVLAAFAATATAVLGYGRYIGVPITVHVLVGLFTVILCLWSLQVGYQTLRANQSLVDRVARELDRLDAELERTGTEPPAEPVDWAFGAPARWLIFAGTAWLPYAYWGLVVWRGQFGRIGTAFPVLTGVASAFGVWMALRSRAQGRTS